MTLKQSSEVHIQALVSADGILPGSRSKLRLLVLNLASVPGGQLVNSPAERIYNACRYKSVHNKWRIFSIAIHLNSLHAFPEQVPENSGQGVLARFDQQFFSVLVIS